jgi:hypothetical protein
MAERHLPVRPDLGQLRHQAKDLLRELRAADPAAKLAHAQHALAKSYGVASWPRLVLACKLVDAIWRDDLAAVRALLLQHPRLLHEDARGVRGSWGPPMSYAANLGRDRIIAMLRDLGARDLQHAFDRACLRGQLDTARALYAMGARPEPDALLGPCEALNPAGLQLLLELDGPHREAQALLAAVALVLQTYARDPDGKHGCLELLARHVELPGTPAMAVHRGRLDLLEAHVRRDPASIHRPYSHEQLFPPEVGCDRDHSLALHGTPLDGATLLHACIDFDEPDLARWLLAHGADVDARAAVDADGFGGHTPLFACAVSQAYRAGRQRDGAIVRLLLDAGADPSIRASLRKRLRFVTDESLHEYRDVTALEWGERFHGREWVSSIALRLIAEHGARS